MATNELGTLNEPAFIEVQLVGATELAVGLFDDDVWPDVVIATGPQFEVFKNLGNGNLDKGSVLPEEPGPSLGRLQLAAVERPTPPDWLVGARPGGAAIGLYAANTFEPVGDDILVPDGCFPSLVRTGRSRQPGASLVVYFGVGCELDPEEPRNATVVAWADAGSAEQTQLFSGSGSVSGAVLGDVDDDALLEMVVLHGQPVGPPSPGRDLSALRWDGVQFSEPTSFIGLADYGGVAAPSAVLGDFNFDGRKELGLVLGDGIEHEPRLAFIEDVLGDWQLTEIPAVPAFLNLTTLRIAEQSQPLLVSSDRDGVIVSLRPVLTG